VWLPTAYTRAEFGWLYILLLVVAPLVLAVIVGWLFYELTAANIAQKNDDRSSGLRRWFAVATPLLVVVGLIPRALETNLDDMWQTFVVAMAVIQVFLGVVLFLFAGEPLERSSRVAWDFQKRKVSRLRRFLGPGIEPALLLVLLLGGGALALLVGLGVWQERWNQLTTGLPDPARLACVLSFGGYALCFLLFLTGFLLFVRARSKDGTAPRVLYVVIVFVANAGPWLLLAMAGMMARVNEVMWLASPSPAFVFQLFDSLLLGRPEAQTQLVAMIVSATLWALLGVTFWALGSRALRRRLLAERRERAPTSPSTAVT
jgi:hypothetical protein